MPDPAASALAVERPNIFAAPASHPRHQPRRGGIFDDTARAESTREAPRSSRSRATPRLSYLAPAVLAIVAAVSLLAVTQERTARTEAGSDLCPPRLAAHPDALAGGTGEGGAAACSPPARSASSRP